MKFKDIAKQKPDQLSKKIDELHRELMKDRAQVASGSTPKNPGNIRRIRKSIARIKTFLNSQTGEEQ